MNELFLVLQETCFYGTIIQTGITYKKIPCHMWGSACQGFIFKKPKAAVSWKFGHCYFLHDFFGALWGNCLLLIILENFFSQFRENRG